MLVFFLLRNSLSLTENNYLVLGERRWSLPIVDLRPANRLPTHSRTLPTIAGREHKRTAENRWNADERDSDEARRKPPSIKPTYAVLSTYIRHRYPPLSARHPFTAMSTSFPRIGVRFRNL